MDIRTQTANEIRRLDRGRILRIRNRFVDEAIIEWDRAESKYPQHYPVFIQVVVGQKWLDLIQSN